MVLSEGNGVWHRTLATLENLQKKLVNKMQQNTKYLSQNRDPYSHPEFLMVCIFVKTR